MYANDDVSYALNRLMKTIIRYKDKAVMVTNVTFVSGDKPLLIQAYYIVEENGDEVNDYITKFDLTPVPLGFINFPEKKQATYLSRIPIREDWRQGLRQQNSRTMWGEAWWGNEQIANTVENKFPTLLNARKNCKGDKQTCAWTRDFAVDGAGHIYYRCEGVVGEFIDDANNYVLNAEYGWVEESLKEALNGYV